jgi:hypothetical protein
MKRSLSSNITHLKRRIAVFFGRIKSTSDQKMKKPKMTVSEEQAVRIWTKVVHQPESDLMYNPQNHEAYARWESPSGTVYLFLESGNMRIINTVVGYDIRLSMKVEQWCSTHFSREVAKRRSKFKRQAESKVIHSLDSLESRLSKIELES